MIRVYISSSLVNFKQLEVCRRSYSLKTELIEWLERHTGQPMLDGEGSARRLNSQRGWCWGGAIYGSRGGYIDFEPQFSNVAVMFKLTWGAYDSISSCSSTNSSN